MRRRASGLHSLLFCARKVHDFDDLIFDDLIFKFDILHKVACTLARRSITKYAAQELEFNSLQNYI